jgi:hypothetical protein
MNELSAQFAPKPAKRRTTARKALIERVLAEEYAGGPVLLEELRWKALIKQYGPTFVEMTDARCKSFARTVREHLPTLIRLSVPIGVAAAGMIARAALYRVRSRAVIDRFLRSEEQIVFVNVGFPDHELQGEQFQRVTVGCFFSDRRLEGKRWRGKLNENALARIIIPKSHCLTVIQTAIVDDDCSLEPIASVPWKIFFFHRHPDRLGQRSQFDEVAALAQLPFKDVGL